MINKRKIGSQQEEKAAKYLESLGYHIIDRNFRYARGEIDIIAKENEYLVFIEVKYRRNDKIGNPSEAIDLRKQRVISKTARYYLYSHGYSFDGLYRFDVILLLDNEIEIIQNAFDAC